MRRRPGPASPGSAGPALTEVAHRRAAASGKTRSGVLRVAEIPDVAIAIGLIALALGLRALEWARTDVIFNDGPTFLSIAHAFGRGDVAGGLAHPFHPLYPLAVALLRGAVPLPEGDALVAAAGIVSVISGGVAVACLWLWLRDAFGRGAAAVGALALAVHPGAVGMAADVQSDGLYLALFLASVMLLWRGLARRSASAAAAAGGLSALAYLTRPEGLAVAAIGLAIGALPVVVPGVFARFAGQPVPDDAAARKPQGHRDVVVRSDRARWVGWWLALAAGAGLVIAPYAGWLGHETGSFALTKKKTVAQLTGVGDASTFHARELVPAPPPSPWHPRGVAAKARDLHTAASIPSPAPPRDIEGSRPPAVPGLSLPPDRPPEAMRSPAAALADLVKTIVRAARYDVLVLLALGLFASRGRPGARGLFVGAFVGVFGALLAGLAVFSGYVSARHVLPPIVLGFGWLAPGATRFGEGVLAAVQWARATVSRPAPGSSSAATAIGVALIAGLGIGHACLPGRDDGLAERLAAEWLRAANAGPAAIAVEKSRVAWYAGRAFVPLRDAPDEETLAWLRAHGTGFVIVDDAALERRPTLARALAHDATLLHRETANGVEARVFALRDGSGAGVPGVSTAPEGR